MRMSNKARKLAIGLMSGTSLDGIDAALVSIEGAGVTTQCELLHFYAHPMPIEVREAILRVSHPDTAKIDEICSLNTELGYLYQTAVEALLVEASQKQIISPTEPIDFIASHGQTIYHQPNATKPFVPSTLQIGDPSPLAYHFKTAVVFNFRMMDLVAGGEGAPLVPYTEYLLYRSETKSRLLQNIGGIGNVTILPKNCVMSEVTAFDTGPGNMMINAAMMQLFNQSYDYNGEHGRKGRLIEALFAELKADPYLEMTPPKSTGREHYGEKRVAKLCERYRRLNQSDQMQYGYDLIHTLTRFTAYTIAESYRRFIFPACKVDEIIVGGGGAYNPLLMAMIRAELPEYSVLTQEDLGISSDAKEAIAFAILGNETLHGLASNMPGSTGARERVILGQIIPNPWPRNEGR